MWCLLKGNIVHNDAIDLLVILARLLEYVMADKLTMGDIEDFEELVDFFEKRAVCVEEYAIGCSDFDFFHILRYNHPSLTP